MRFFTLFSDLADLKTLLINTAVDLHNFKRELMATEAQILTALTGYQTEIGKIVIEVQALIAAVKAAGGTSAAVDAALASTQTALDGLNTLAAPPPAP